MPRALVRRYLARSRGRPELASGMPPARGTGGGGGFSRREGRREGIGRAPGNREPSPGSRGRRARWNPSMREQLVASIHAASGALVNERKEQGTPAACSACVTAANLRRVRVDGSLRIADVPHPHASREVRAGTTMSTPRKWCSSTTIPFQHRERLDSNGSGRGPGIAGVVGSLGNEGPLNMIDVSGSRSNSARGRCRAPAPRRHARGQNMCCPPLIAMLAPVTKAASSLAR